MNVKPILFSAPMVQAILREIQMPGTGKTQTRRVLNPQPPAGHALVGVYAPGLTAVFNPAGREGAFDSAADVAARIPYLPRRDLLWVREPWWTEARWDHLSPANLPRTVPLYFQTDPEPGCAGRYRQARFLCRWMSRITLIVTDVRVQRLTDISANDVRAEGVEFGVRGGAGDYRWQFAALWNRINGPDAWDADPWVAAYTFRPVGANVDAVLADPVAYGLGGE